MRKPHRDDEPVGFCILHTDSESRPTPISVIDGIPLRYGRRAPRDRIQGMNSEPPATGPASGYLIGSETSLFAVSRLKIGFRPVLATIGLGGLVILPSGVVYFFFSNGKGGSTTTVEFLIANHTVMLLIALALMAWLSRGKFGEWGLKWPAQKRYAGAALAWGAAFGVLMTGVDYLPQILRHTAPPDVPRLTAGSIGLWMFFEGIFVGPTEEIPFRGLMQTFLIQRAEGRVRLGKFEMHVAGVVLAVLFALAHLTSFWQENAWIALGQQIYAFALGILYAYWREKSGSLLAPIIGHNVGDGLEYFLMFLMKWAWG